MTQLAKSMYRLFLKPRTAMLPSKTKRWVEQPGPSVTLVKLQLRLRLHMAQLDEDHQGMAARDNLDV